MPHIIIEHSTNISQNTIISLQKEILNNMPSISGANFALDQCKARSFSFNQYLLGENNQENASFIHISIKILNTRSLEIKKELSKQTLEIAKKIIEKQALEKPITDISVDIIDMEKETYQKDRILK